MREEVIRWLQDGGDPDAGLAIMQKYGLKNDMLVRMVQANKAKNAKLLIDFLSRKCDVKYVVPNTQQPSQRKQQNFRDEFQFLQSPDCPIELKILVTDKFSTFYKYKKLHARLFDCTSLNECTETASELISSLKENRAIYAELNYYKQHGSVLGKHKVFSHYRKMEDLKNLSIRELIEKERNLKHNIWRIESEMKKSDRPDLNIERENRLKMKQAELAQVQRLIG